MGDTSLQVWHAICSDVTSVACAPVENEGRLRTLIAGDAKAVGEVAGDAVVGMDAGYFADKALRAGGVDQVVGNAVPGAVDAVKGWFK